jgi:flagellar basal body-associated protein FliL
MSENINTNVTKEEKVGKVKISEKNLAIIITAALLAVIAIATAIVFVVQAIKSDAGFNYLKSDLDKYIEFTSDYKNLSFDLDIAKPKDIDADVALLKLQAAAKTGNGKEKVLDGYSWEIGAGDSIDIYYRGYIIGAGGEQIAAEGMSNFGNAEPQTLVIGSGSFVPGFELNIVGLKTDETNRFEKITTGKPGENQIAYVSYTRTDSSDANKKVTVTNERIDLSRTDIDEVYGQNFKNTITSTTIGTKVALLSALNGNDYNYTDLVVNFVTECETKHFTVECYFPYNYKNENLRNETAYFEVYVNKFVDFDAPELNDEFIKKQIEDKKITVTEQELAEYEGETLVDKYVAYYNEQLMENYEKEYETLVRDRIVEILRSISKAKKYPGGKVDEVYDDYYNTVNDSFITNEGKITNSYGSSNTYQTLDTYAVAYLGLQTGADWKAYILGLAQDSIKERMMLFYLVRNENLIPAKDEFKDLVNETREESIAKYTAQYLAYLGKTKEEYTAEAYAEFEAQCRKEVLNYYTDEYFEETTYYELLLKEAMNWVDVNTLDERRAYPIDK